MINYDLPTEIEINGISYPITRGGDYRVALDCISALNDKKLSEQEKAITVLYMFYGCIPEDTQTAIEKIMWFINCGETAKNEGKEHKSYMDWEQDFPLLVSPLNKVLGYDVRDTNKNTHWWTFISAYMEIGDCTFAEVVKIRKKRDKGQKLDKQEQQFMREHADIIILKNQLSQEEKDFLDEEW